METNNLHFLTRLHVVVLGLFVFFATGCGAVAVKPTPSPILFPTETNTSVPTGRGAGDTLRLVYWEAPTILNPHLTSANKDFEASRIIYEPLASFDREGNLVPFLAAEIPSLENGGVAEDGTSVTWKLKSGVQWSDGEPFTADDVLFTYEFITNPEVGSGNAFAYDLVDRVEVVDDTTVTVYFQKATPSWATPFVGIPGMILPRHKFADYVGKDVRDAPANWGREDGDTIGTGPYRVVSFRSREVLFLGTELVETNKIVYEPNPYFREQDKPYFSRVELLGGGVANQAAKSVFVDGTADYAYNLQVSDQELQKMEQEGNGIGQVAMNFGSRLLFLDLNRTDPISGSSLKYPHPFFKDKAMRQAILYAIDREKIASDIFGRAGKVTSNILVSPEQYQSPNTTYVYDLEKAIELLDEAGWTDSDGDGIRDKDGKPLEFVYQTGVNSLYQAAQSEIKNELEAIGIGVDIKLIDVSVFFSGDPTKDTSEKFQADMQTYDVTMDSIDPCAYLGWWKCDQIPQEENNWLAGFNVARWCNKEFDTLQEQCVSELDPEKQRDIIIQMNDLFIEDIVTIPLVHIADISGMSTSLEGIDLTPWDADVWNIKDWRRQSTS